MDNEKQMPFTEHLGELRRRILISIASVFVIFLCTFHFSEYIFEAITLPMKEDIFFSLDPPFVQFVPKNVEQTSLVFLAPAEAFWMHLKISLMTALAICIPVILYQIWQFTAPGLLQHERKYFLPFIFAGTSLFMIGAFFCFILVLPFAMGFLLTYKTGSLTPMISVGSYVDFTLKFILAFGVVFELPIALIFLTKIGVVTPAKLRKNRKYAIIMAFVAAAMLTPTPDAFNQTLMAGPIIVLYELGILASVLFYKERKPEDEKSIVPE